MSFSRILHQPWFGPLAALFALMVLYGVVAALERTTGVAVGTCTMRRVTGVPCPTCGSTRAASSLAHGDLLGALQMNPLVTLIYVGLPTVFTRALMRRERGARTSILARIAESRIPAVLLVAVFLVNWCYVVATQG